MGQVKTEALRPAMKTVAIIQLNLIVAWTQ